MVGHLYFSVGTSLAMCSATVVARSVILTAAHCVAFSDGLHDNFLFVPAQMGNNAPYGGWTASASQARIFQYWIDSNYSFFPMDYSFIRMNANQAGKLVGDVVGYLGVIANFLASAPANPNILDLGYPASGAFAPTGGKYMFYCYSPWGSSQWQSPFPGWFYLGIGCAMTGGASGGPWLYQYQGAFYVASVNSTCWAAGIFCKDYLSDNLWGAYFNDWTMFLFSQV
jgi:hypothetical protein